MIVLFFRGLIPDRPWKYVFLPIFLLGLPLLISAVLMAHLALVFGLGSEDDPLGYTIILKK